MPIPLIDSLATEELVAMKAELEEVIRQRQETDRKAVLQQIRAIAASIGCTVEQLLDRAPARSGKKHKAGVPKYRNPENPSQTWTGKGARPQWFLAATNRGVSPEQLLIQ